nr:hypothetical protein [Tanacetum cinerariifolium]
MRWRYLVPTESHIHNRMLIPNYQDNKYQDFRYSDELSNLGRYEHVSPMSLEHKEKFPLPVKKVPTDKRKEMPLEEGIDYEEVFAPVARIEAIRLFLAYSSLMGFMVYQMDGKSAFLYETIEEEVYACQALGFEDPDYPDKRGDILLIQIYVDDIIFGLTNKDLCKSFEKLMKDKFQMSSMGQLTFFLDLQVKPKKDRIFISQDKYVAEILRKFRLTDRKSASIPIDTEKPLLKDLDGVNTPRCDEDRLEINGIAVFLLPKFWTTVAVKKINDVTRLQALVNKKKVVITKAAIRDTLRLDDPEGVECLYNEEIFAELARMGYKKPSTKLTFYKVFFSGQWNFLIHTLLQCMSAKRNSWNELSSSMASAVICLSSGKGFSGVETPLFEGMVVEQQVVKGDVDEVHCEDVNAAGVVTEGVVSAVDNDAGISMNLLQDLMDTCIALTRRAKHLELDKIAQALEITKLKQRVKKLEKRNKLKGGIIENIDADEDVVLEEPKDVAANIVKDIQDADVEESAHDQGRQAESQAKIYKINLDHANKVLSIQKEETEPAKLQEVVDVTSSFLFCSTSLIQVLFLSLMEDVFKHYSSWAPS